MRHGQSRLPSRLLLSPHYSASSSLLTDSVVAGTRSYVDALSCQIMFSLAVPVYVGDHWAGVIGVDIVLAGMSNLLSGETGTPSGFTVVIDGLGHTSGDRTAIDVRDAVLPAALRGWQ
eukprot:3548697-Rhodomonas_salina.1